MATATAQDDDLLIIADDDTSSDTSGDIEFSFDFGEDISSDTSSEAASDVASEDTVISEVTAQEETSEILPEITAGEEAITPEVETIDMSLDISDTSVDTPELEETVVAQEANGSEDFSFDLSEVTPEITTPVIDEAPTTQTGEVEDKLMQEMPIVEAPVEVAETPDVVTGNSMNDILSGTIAKLEARQEVIASDKSGKATKEEEIKAQIKDLQAQVKQLESEMSTLDSESDKITANIAELENMKLDPVKEHNAKRVTKK